MTEFELNYSVKCIMLVETHLQCEITRMQSYPTLAGTYGWMQF